MAHAVPIAWSFTEIKQVFGEVTGKGLWVKAWFYDWILTETQNSTSVTRVIPDQVLVKIIGRAVRTFKPRAPFDIQVCIFFRSFKPVSVLEYGTSKKPVPKKIQKFCYPIN